MSIIDYFSDAIKRIKSEIEQESEEYVLNINSEKLAEYYAQKYSLPLIEKDENRKIKIEKGKSRHGRVPLRVFYPIISKENLQTVVKKYASTRFMSRFPFELQGDWLATTTEMRDESALKKHIENLEKVIEWKNNNVRAGNKNIRTSIKNYIKNTQDILKQEYEELESIVEKVGVPLVVKRDEPLPVIDFTVKEDLKPLIKPEPKKRKERTLDNNKVITLIDYIRNSCLSFEKTPKVFSELEEEALRDIILGNLNAIFPGEATSETFSKLGKTDISLRISEGNILIIECKHWAGQRKYINGISQLFRYLTWRENHGIIITFSKRKGFTNVIRKAKESTQKHKTFINISLSERNASEFISEHRFPDDVEKKVKVYHLLFNLNAG